MCEKKGGGSSTLASPTPTEGALRASGLIVGPNDGQHWSVLGWMWPDKEGWTAKGLATKGGGGWWDIAKEGGGIEREKETMYAALTRTHVHTTHTHTCVVAFFCVYVYVKRTYVRTCMRTLLMPVCTCMVCVCVCVNVSFLINAPGQ